MVMFVLFIYPQNNNQYYYEEEYIFSMVVPYRSVDGMCVLLISTQ